MQCPVCSAELPNTAKFCGSCGTTLSPQPSPPPPAPTYEPQPPPSPGFQQPPPAMSSSPSYGFAGNAPPPVKKKYKALRLIAVLLKILAVIAGVALIIGGLVMAVAGAASSSRTSTTPTFSEPGPAALFGGLVGGLVLVVYGVFVFVFLYAYAEWMYVFMDIEENTRLTNEMLSARK